MYQNYVKKVSEYDQGIPQSHTADQLTALWGSGCILAKEYGL